MTYLKMLIGIKSLNTKQCPARFSPPHVKLSSFIGGKFSPKKERVIYVAYLCVCKSKELYDLRYKSNKFQYTCNFWEWVLIKT